MIDLHEPVCKHIFISLSRLCAYNVSAIDEYRAMEILAKLEQWVNASPQEADTPFMNVTTQRKITLRQLLTELKKEQETGIATLAAHSPNRHIHTFNLSVDRSAHRGSGLDNVVSTETGCSSPIHMR